MSFSLLISTLRFCDENKEKLFHVIAIIITSFAPHNYSGLPSILLSLSDLGVGQVTICGPPGLTAILHLMSPFTNRKYPEITIVEIEDEIRVVNLESMILYIQPVWANTKQTSYPIAISTIIKLPNELKDGKMLSSCNLLVAPTESKFNTIPCIQDILSWGNQNCCKIVLFVPLTVNICETFANQNIIDLCKKELVVGINITGTLKSNICEFRQPQKSIFIANSLCKYLFPQSIEKENRDLTANKCSEDEEQITVAKLGDVIEALPHMIVQFTFNNEHIDNETASRKRKAIESENYTIHVVQPLDLSFSKEIEETANKCNEIDSFKLSVTNMPPPNPFDINIAFLGTGAAKSSKYRSNSCISISSCVGSPLSSDKPRVTVLLDVGESVCTQMYFSASGDLNRYYKLLLSISLIWISHHHADHICGFPFLLQQISCAQKSHCRQNKDSNCIDIDSEESSIRKILVICPNTVLKYYEYCACIAGLEDLIELVPTNQTLYVGCTTKIIESTGGFVQRLISIPVQHCHESYAVILETVNGFKLVYSGDCRPSSSIISAGMNCDILIHEATFDDAMSGDAIKKQHSTTSEAVGMGIRMKCKHIILTHFSQRYMSTAQVELTNNNDQQLTRYRYSVAYDFMRFAYPTQINCLPMITTTLSKFYEEYYDLRKRSS
jgi:ribonuclease BN (tRNA processing enzyme)